MLWLKHAATSSQIELLFEVVLSNKMQPINVMVIFRGTNYVIVSDAVGHIFPLPESISLSVATKLGDKGVQALALVQALEERCLDLLEQVQGVDTNE